MRIRKVDTSSPIVPVVRSASKMDIAELMTVLPKRSVQRRRLPCLRTAKRKASSVFLGWHKQMHYFSYCHSAGALYFLQC